MQETKLLSYTTIDFQTKAQMNLYIKYIEQVENDKYSSEELKKSRIIKKNTLSNMEFSKRF